MIPRLWKELVVGNPMLIEIQRYRRRYLSFSGTHAVNSAVLALGLLCYAGLVLLVCNFRGALPPITLIEFQTGLFALFAPGMLYATIAGERERRSWDLLLVAPISKAQIVMGKFIGALTALAIAAGFLLVPIFIAAVSYGAGDSYSLRSEVTNWPDLVLAELLSLSFTVAVCALTILFSARVRRPFMAMANTLGILIIGLILFPAFLTSLGMYGPGDQVVLFLHPFISLDAIQQVDDHSNRTVTQSGISAAYWGWPHILLYLSIAGVFIGWAVNTLVFAENDVKFIPRRAVDA